MKRKKQKIKLKKGAWFVKIRGSYLPCTWQGWLTYIPFVAYLVLSFGAIVRDTGSVLMMIYLLVPAWIAGAVIMTWIAQRKS